MWKWDICTFSEGEELDTSKESDSESDEKDAESDTQTKKQLLFQLPTQLPLNVLVLQRRTNQERH